MPSLLFFLFLILSCASSFSVSLSSLSLALSLALSPSLMDVVVLFCSISCLVGAAFVLQSPHNHSRHCVSGFELLCMLLRMFSVYLSPSPSPSLLSPSLLHLLFQPVCQ